MNLQFQLASLKNQSGDLTLVQRAELSCRLAKQLEKAGEYEKACEALEEFWPDHNAPPKLEGLDREMTAQVLLRTGALAGWLGSSHQSNGSQETAKDLITQSLQVFEELGQSEGVAEAGSDLAVCYWREGAFDEARINLEIALTRLANGSPELRAVILTRTSMVEMAAHRLNEALRILNGASPLVDEGTDHALKGSFHNLFAVLLKNLAAAENRQDYIDRALIEYAAASFHFEQAGHIRYQGCVDINLGFLFSIIGRFAEAHKHLDRARDLFLAIGDNVHLAQVNDTRARAMLSEGRLAEAEKFSRSAVKTLDKGDEQALLAEALTTYATVLARTGKEPSARLQIQRAIETAETAGDLEGAGRAQLTFIEELNTQSPMKDLVMVYRAAIGSLKNSQDASTTKRLISCAEILFDALTGLDQTEELGESTWEGFSLKQYVRQSEGSVIERALRDAGGSVTRAARLLGFNHHQSLIHLINSRHRELLNARSSVRPRRRQISLKPKGTKRIRKTPKQITGQISILHVEDHRMVANLVGEILTSEGWRVDLCMDGDSALRKLTGKDRYDVLIIDNNLPGLSGLELVQRARLISHRRRTPIIMLSGDDLEKEAWRAGVDDFLRKPDAVNELVSRITRVLQKRREKSRTK